jgi:hypothetical protein
MSPPRVPRGRARSLEDYLSADASLARLSAHARRLLQFQRLFEAVTPLARQSRIANVRLGKIVIHANNSTVATKLRQLEPRLVAVFRNEVTEVTGLDIRLQPRSASPGPIRKEPVAGIGVRQKHALTSLADGLPEGSSLKEALKRLVSRSR